ncbi:MAG: hypothetical protein KKD01_02840 [Proteobacteria bacterium]|nr:hypothetical protein [Pseudomonadota bacterium]MBU1232401.1 hypothetical protein [Pseudomonadota bacterium]MBU1417188.1 hypothetical protein [Pseudomonadota bacterium]MBU1453638.1 hypothetical protein [Pseudomonadota bacterium]
MASAYHIRLFFGKKIIAFLLVTVSSSPLDLTVSLLYNRKRKDFYSFEGVELLIFYME